MSEILTKKLKVNERKKLAAFMRKKQGNNKLAMELTGLSLGTLKRAILGGEISKESFNKIEKNIDRLK